MPKITYAADPAPADPRQCKLRLRDKRKFVIPEPAGQLMTRLSAETDVHVPGSQHHRPQIAITDTSGQTHVLAPEDLDGAAITT